MTSSDHLRGVTEVDSDGGGDFEDFLEGEIFSEQVLGVLVRFYWGLSLR